MPKAKTPTFILELPLVVSFAQDRIMLGRMEAGRRLYNAVLHEALNRLARMRQSKDWHAARVLPKSKARSEAFKACNTAFGFSEYALQSVATRHKNAAGFDDRLGAHETQKIGSRVWKAVSEYAFGARGKPRFKGLNRPLHSLEGKDNKAGVRWLGDTGCVSWGKLILPARLARRDQDPYQYEALKSPTKYGRIVWRQQHGQRRWFVQLVQGGTAPAKYDFLAQGQVVGLDLGPSSIAIVGEHAVAQERFAPSVDQPWKAIRREQRALDRSRRATNPERFNADGTAKRGTKGGKPWKKSERYKARQAKLAELERRLAATRKKEHGTLANQILGLGTIVQTESLAYTAWQKNFGKSIKVRAPGAFITLLSRKAESAGGELVELNTGRLRMSQYDHVTGECTKKPLSQRWHRLGGGTGQLVQRDSYSAFLAKHVQEGRHSPSRLEEGWAVAEPLLRRAGLCRIESTSGLPSGSPTVGIPSESIARRRRLMRGQTREVVGIPPESPDAPRRNAFRTPCL